MNAGVPLPFVPVATVGDAFDWFANWLPAADAALGRGATVLCSSARAHALRRTFAVERRQAGRLLGVRFLDPIVLARELLARAGTPRALGWEDVRRLHIHHCFDGGELRGRLRYFDVDQLRSGRGYADAFARAIVDLEASGLDPELMKRTAGAMTRNDAAAGDRALDVATVWAAVDTERGARRSGAQLLVEAAATVRAQPALTEPFGPVAAFVTASPPVVLLQFFAALPGCTVVFLEARPLRAHTQRWRTAVAPAGAPRAVPRTDDSTPPSELALAQQYLFAPSDVVADPARPRSAGPDGTLDLEAYPGIEDEIEAAAIWVEEQIAAGVPLEEIALVVPALDPHARLLLDRLGRASAPVGAHVAGGLPLGDSPAGLRLGSLLRALGRGLDAEATLAVLPALRRTTDDETLPRLSPSRAAEIVYGAGIVGGSTTNPTGALEWLPRLQQRRESLQQSLSQLSPSDGEREQRWDLYTRRDAERWLRDVEPLLAAIEALQTLAAIIIEGRPLRAIWPAIRVFVDAHLRVPPDPVNALALIEERLEPVLDDRGAAPLADAVRGFSALTYVLGVIADVRIAHGRFGEPALFIGTADRAAGLPFRAVRVLGLAEGIVPGTPHDDPILPNEARGQLEAALRTSHPEVVIPRLEDRVLDDLHALFRVISGTRERLALSAPRQWIDRSEREVSGVMLEVAAALARGSSGEGDVPTAARLRATYYAPSRARRTAAAQRSVQARAVLAHAPRHRETGWRVPAGWCADGAIALDRLRALTTDTAPATALDGFVASAWPAVAVPGLAPERPISATALGTLLQCPHRFLLENILHFSEPARRPSTDTIDAREYGSLFHRAAETFFHAHGAALCAHEKALDEWLRRARHVAEEQFEIWRAQYPLRGDDSIGRERQRLVRQIEQLIELEWRMPRRTFVDAEHGFGDPQPVQLTLESGALYVTGQIDRIDQLDTAGLSVRDLKTGRVHDFREEPCNSRRDLQIGLYVLALEAEQPTPPVAHAAYVHPSAAQEPERRFEQSDLAALRESTRTWLTVARGLLATGAFPRTPLPPDCTYCPFRPACGDGAQTRSAAQLKAGPLTIEVAAFAQLKQQESEDVANN